MQPKDTNSPPDARPSPEKHDAASRMSDMPVEALVYWLYTFRAGKVVQMDAYLDRAKALEAAGLSE